MIFPAHRLKGGTVMKGSQDSNYGLLTSFEIRAGDSCDDSCYYTFEDEEIRKGNGIKGFSSN